MSKKDAKALVYHKLETALSEFQKDIKPKKFRAKLKRASKLFASTIAKLSEKKDGPKQKEKKKSSKIKKTAQSAPLRPDTVSSN